MARTWEAVRRALTALTRASTLYPSAGSVMEAITAPPEMAQLPPASVWKDSTAHGGTRLHDLRQWLEVHNTNTVYWFFWTLNASKASFDLPLQIMFSKVTNYSRFPVSATSWTRWTMSCRPLLPAGLHLPSALPTRNLLQPLQFGFPGNFDPVLTCTYLTHFKDSHRSLPYFFHIQASRWNKSLAGRQSQVISQR